MHLNQIAERGRQPSISMFVIFHSITNSPKTKLTLTKADYFIIFPKTLCFGFQNKQRVVKEADQNEIQRIEVKNTAGDEEEGEDKHDVFIHIEALT